jgi:hypothetical protein
MKILILLLMCLPAMACMTTPDGERVPDWDRIAADCDFAAAELTDFANITEDNGLRADLVTLAQLATDTANAARAVEHDGVNDLVADILRVSAPFLDEYASPEVRRIILALRATARLVVLFTN